MLIANPIYDVVFKRMMENKRVAKFFVSTLLKQPIEDIELSPQEFTYTDDYARISVFRLDFIATIKTSAGELRKVLIEIQKAKNDIDILRFRNYLGEQYKKQDEIGQEKRVLPITTIYILGFRIPEIDTPCMKVGRYYEDLISDRMIEAKSEFVEKLTHDCYVVQVDRITDDYRTDLEKLLSVFGQTNFVDGTKITKLFNHEADIEEVRIMTDILHYSGTDPKEKKIEAEQEAWRTVYAANEKERKERAFEKPCGKRQGIERGKAGAGRDETGIGRKGQGVE